MREVRREGRGRGGEVGGWGRPAGVAVGVGAEAGDEGAGSSLLLLLLRWRRPTPALVVAEVVEVGNSPAPDAKRLEGPLMTQSNWSKAKRLRERAALLLLR